MVNEQQRDERHKARQQRLKEQVDVDCGGPGRSGLIVNTVMRTRKSTPPGFKYRLSRGGTWSSKRPWVQFIKGTWPAVNAIWLSSAGVEFHAAPPALPGENPGSASRYPSGPGGLARSRALLADPDIQCWCCWMNWTLCAFADHLDPLDEVEAWSIVRRCNIGDHRRGCHRARCWKAGRCRQRG